MIKAITFVFLLGCATMARAVTPVTGTIEVIPTTWMRFEKPLPTAPAIKVDKEVMGSPPGTILQIQAFTAADDAEIRRLVGKRATIKCAGIFESATSQFYTPWYCALDKMHK